MDFAHTFSKNYRFFFCKHYTFYTKSLFIRPKNYVQSILYNKRWKEFCKNQIFCNNSKIYGFRQYVFKKLEFFFVFFNKDYTFYTKNLFIGPKNCVQSILYNERCKEFHKNQFFSNIFTFLSVTRQNFEDNLRILANFGKFSRKNSRLYGFRPYVFKKVVFLFFCIF